MNQRLIWNFEFKMLEFYLQTKDSVEKESCKWEARYFWPSDQIIVLHAIHTSMLDLSNYKRKVHDDHYYVAADKPFNLKERNGQIIYKPLISQSSKAVAFGPKIALQTIEDWEILNAIKNNTPIRVQKQTFTYKFSLTAPVKLELSQIRLLDKVYYSACIEGRSQALVEHLSDMMVLPDKPTCDYVCFLQNAVQL